MCTVPFRTARKLNPRAALTQRRGVRVFVQGCVVEADTIIISSALIDQMVETSTHVIEIPYFGHCQYIDCTSFFCHTQFTSERNNCFDFYLSHFYFAALSMTVNLNSRSRVKIWDASSNYTVGIPSVILFSQQNALENAERRKKTPCWIKRKEFPR